MTAKSKIEEFGLDSPVDPAFPQGLAAKPRFQSPQVFAQGFWNGRRLWRDPASRRVALLD